MDTINISAVKDNLDKLKQKAINAKDNIVKNFKSMNIKPCEGDGFEYVSNDEDYNEFLKNEGFDERGYVDIPIYTNSEVKEKKTNEQDNADAANNKEAKSSPFENISETIVGKINKIKQVIDETAEKKSEKKDLLREDIGNIQTSVYSIDGEIKKLIDQTEYLSKEIENIKESNAALKVDNEAVAKELRSSSASASFALEKMMGDMVDLNTKINIISETAIDLSAKITAASSENDSTKNEISNIKNTINKLGIEISEVIEIQHLLKDSVSSLNSAMDSVNRKLTTGFVTVGILSAICAVLTVVFHIL